MVAVGGVVMEFFIPDLPKLPNQMLRKHWTFVMKEKKKWHNLVVFYSPIPEGPPLKKAKLTLIRKSSRQPDFDGLVGSFKHVVDGLVKVKIIVDDKCDVIGESKYLWEKCKRVDQGILVRVEEMGV